MKSKLFLVITFVFTTVSAGMVMVEEIDSTKVSFSLTNTWQSHGKKDHCCSCHCKPDTPDWVEGVQGYYDGITDAVKTFPSDGPSLGLANAVMTTFQKFLTKVISYSTSNSTILSSSSSVILEALSKLDKLASSPNTIIVEFDKVLADLVKVYKDIVTKLSETIGEATACIIEGLDKLEGALKQYMEEFLKCDSVESKREVDFEPVRRRVQILSYTISQSSLTKCDATADVQDALKVLRLIFEHLSICVGGINASSAAIVYEKKPTVLRTNLLLISMSVCSIDLHPPKCTCSTVRGNTKGFLNFLRGLAATKVK